MVERSAMRSNGQAAGHGLMPCVRDGVRVRAAMRLSPIAITDSGPSGMLRTRWRLLSLALLLMVLIGFIVALTCMGTPRAMRAAMALGGTLAGMLALAVFVCRR